jgi:hypothetical protein
VSVSNGAAIFQKMHAKSIPTLPLNSSIGSAVAFLRAAGKLASNGDFSMAIQAIAAHAQELAIVTIANAANSVTFSGWNSSQRAVLKHCVTAPGPCASAENDLRECPGRLQHESFDTYYTRFQTKYEVCIYVRTLFNELTSSDWANTYHRQWVLNLNIADAYMLTMTITPLSSFATVFASVCRSVSPAIRAGTPEPNPSVRQERVTHMTPTPTPSVHTYEDHLNQLKVIFENLIDDPIAQPHHFPKFAQPLTVTGTPKPC